MNALTLDLGFDPVELIVADVHPDPTKTHRYTVDVVLHGVEPYPCIICGGWRLDPLHVDVHPDPIPEELIDSVAQVIYRRRDGLRRLDRERTRDALAVAVAWRDSEGRPFLRALRG